MKMLQVDGLAYAVSVAYDSSMALRNLHWGLFCSCDVCEAALSQYYRWRWIAQLSIWTFAAAVCTGALGFAVLVRPRIRAIVLGSG